jgi:hypothetical protein
MPKLTIDLDLTDQQIRELDRIAEFHKQGLSEYLNRVLKQSVDTATQANTIAAGDVDFNTCKTCPQVFAFTKGAGRIGPFENCQQHAAYKPLPPDMIPPELASRDADVVPIPKRTRRKPSVTPDPSAN